MRRLIVLLAASAAAVAAARASARRRAERALPKESAMTPNPPTPPAPREEPPAPAPAAKADEPPAAPTPTPDEPPAAPTPTPDEPPRSAVSPAAETVKAVDATEEAAPARPDEDVARDAEAQVAEVPHAEGAQIEVEVRDRIASIEGTAPDRETAMQIRDEVAHVEGVQGLENHLVVQQEESSPEPPAQEAGDPSENDD
jgi:hypothetical protein